MALTSSGKLLGVLAIAVASVACSGVSVSDESARHLEAVEQGPVGACPPGVSGPPSSIVQFQNGLAVPGVAGPYAGTSDVYLESAKSSTNYAASANLISKAGKVSLIRFDLSSIPPGTPLSCASFGYYVQDRSTRSFRVFALERDWTDTGASWLTDGSSSGWGAPGASASSDRGSVEIATVAGAKAGQYYTPISPQVVQEWIDDPAQNHGFIVANAAANDGINIASSETTSPATSLRPSLFVGYAH